MLITHSIQHFFINEIHYDYVGDLLTAPTHHASDDPISPEVRCHEGSRVVAALGLTDVVLIDTEEAVLVCAEDQGQAVRRLAEQVRSLNARTPTRV